MTRNQQASINELLSFSFLPSSPLLTEERVSLYRLGWPGVHNVDQAGLELAEVCLPLPLER